MKILKSILNLIGIQCSNNSRGGGGHECAYWLQLKALLRVLDRLETFWLKQVKRELKWSKPEEIKAWMIS